MFSGEHFRIHAQLEMVYKQKSLVLAIYHITIYALVIQLGQHDPLGRWEFWAGNAQVRTKTKNSRTILYEETYWGSPSILQFRNLFWGTRKRERNEKAFSVYFFSFSSYTSRSDLLFIRKKKILKHHFSSCGLFCDDSWGRCARCVGPKSPVFLWMLATSVNFVRTITASEIF